MKVSVGSELPPIAFTPSRLQLFRFSAVTWNSHRIHYDESYARSEGHADVVVQSTLRGEQLLGVVRSWFGDRGEIRMFEWRNLLPAHPDQTVTCTGTVVALDGDLVRIALEARGHGGDVVTRGSASVSVAATDR
jgi:hydroxyacyl-ACP dehydratase HTD2-like protein with hotdog domain